MIDVFIEHYIFTIRLNNFGKSKMLNIVEFKIRHHVQKAHCALTRSQVTLRDFNVEFCVTGLSHKAFTDWFVSMFLAICAPRWLHSHPLFINELKCVD